MLKFKEYISEEVDPDTINVDNKYLAGNRDELNATLDVITSKPYQNAPIMLAQMRACFERYGILLPASMTDHFLNLNAEVAYALGDSGDYLYVVYDTNDDGFVDGYAQVVDESELTELLDTMGSDVLNKDRNMIAVQHSDWYRKRDDDAGNTAEY